MRNKITDGLKKIVSAENVLTDKEELYVYSKDASNQIAMPDYVVFVESGEQVQAVMRLAYETKTPVICRGAGTNVVGACVAARGGIILNFSKMNKIIEINHKNMTAKVQPGVVVGKLQEAVEKIGLFYPPDPSNLAVSTIGGSIAQSAGGPRTFKYGSTKDYVLDLKIVTADGSVMETGSNTVKNSTGYHLSQLFVGSEGTLGIVVEAVLKLTPKPQGSRVIMAYFDKVSDATGAVDKIIEAQLTPATIDLMDKNSIETVERFYPAGLMCGKAAALIIEVDGYLNSLDYQQDEIVRILESSSAVGIAASKTDEEAQKIWTARRSSFGATAKLAPNVMTEDVIVPRNKMAELMEGIGDICRAHNLQVCIVGHVGDGNVHPQMALDLRNEDEYNHYIKAKEEIYNLTIKLGGTLSAEHGIGCEKINYISDALDPLALDYMRKIKQLFDPNNILNPDKVFKEE